MEHRVASLDDDDRRGRSPWVGRHDLGNLLDQLPVSVLECGDQAPELIWVHPRALRLECLSELLQASRLAGRMVMQAQRIDARKLGADAERLNLDEGRPRVQ